MTNITNEPLDDDMTASEARLQQATKNRESLRRAAESIQGANLLEASMGVVAEIMLKGKAGPVKTEDGEWTLGGITPADESFERDNMNLYFREEDAELDKNIFMQVYRGKTGDTDTYIYDFRNSDKSKPKMVTGKGLVIHTKDGKCVGAHVAQAVRDSSYGYTETRLITIGDGQPLDQPTFDEYNNLVMNLSAEVSGIK